MTTVRPSVPGKSFPQGNRHCRKQLADAVQAMRHNTRLRRLRTLPLVAVLVAVGGGTAHAVQYNTIALSGATGTSRGLGPSQGTGVDFSSFSLLSLNATGE